MSYRRKKQNASKLERSFIDITVHCVEKARNVFKIKESGLVRMAENVLFYGIAEGDMNSNDIIKTYFLKLNSAFSCFNQYYLSSDYVFLFCNETLIDIIAIHPAFRSGVQSVFVSNKKSWEGLPLEERQSHIEKVKKDILDLGLYSDVSSSFVSDY